MTKSVDLSARPIYGRLAGGTDADNSSNNKINVLFAAVTEGKGLLQSLEGGATIQKGIDYLAELALKSNNLECNELLFNISLGEGGAAGYAQQKLCEIVCDPVSDNGRDAAETTRSNAEYLISNGKEGAFFRDLRLDEKPKLLFIAATKIKGETHPEEKIAALVKEKVAEYEKKDVKPQWWVDFAPKDGVFTGTPSCTTTESLARKNYLVKEHKVSNDGACFFRAVFSLQNGDGEAWLNKDLKPSSEVLAEITKFKGQDLIKQAIRESIDCLKKAECKLGDKFQDTEVATQTIYEKTIASGDFTLYSAVGIGNAFGLTVKKDDELFSLIADAIGNKLFEKFDAPKNSDAPDGAYLIQREGNHWNLIKPVSEGPLEATTFVGDMQLKAVDQPFFAPQAGAANGSVRNKAPLALNTSSEHPSALSPSSKFRLPTFVRNLFARPSKVKSPSLSAESQASSQAVGKRQGDGVGSRPVGRTAGMGREERVTHPATGFEASEATVLSPQQGGASSPTEALGPSELANMWSVGAARIGAFTGPISTVSDGRELESNQLRGAGAGLKPVAVRQRAGSQLPDRIYEASLPAFLLESLSAQQETYV